MGMRRLRHWDVRTPSSDSARIEPAAVFWSVVPFEALDQAPGFDGRKGFVFSFEMITRAGVGTSNAG